MDKIIKKDSKIFVLVRSILISYILTGILLLLLALLLFKFRIPSNIISIGIIITYIISNFVGGLLIGNGVEEKKFLWGILCGSSYFVIMLIVSFVMGGHMFNYIGSVITVLLMCTLGGMLGGMVS